MNCRVHDLKYKNVINMVDGSMLGFVNDVEIDTCDAKIVSIVIYGKFNVVADGSLFQGCFFQC